MIGFEQFALIINGLLLGGVYALIAFGLSFTYGVCGVLNLAHGDFLILGSIVALLLIDFLNVDPFLTVLIIFPLFFIIGMGVSRALIRRIMAKARGMILISSIIVTAGLSFAIEDASAYFTNTILYMPFYSISYVNPPIQINGYALPISYTRTIIFVIILAITAVFHELIKRSRIGMLIRAITENREAAVMIGAKVEHITTLTFGLGAALAATSGVFLALITCFTAFHGLQLTVKALTVIILGGIGSLGGTIWGGILLGLAETYAAYYLGGSWALPFSIVILIIVLLIRPAGMLGEK